VRLRFALSSIARQCLFRALHSQQSISAQSTSIVSNQKAKGGAQNRAIFKFAAQRAINPNILDGHTIGQ
jgi:hypothetical protein